MVRRTTNVVGLVAGLAGLCAQAAVLRSSVLKQQEALRVDHVESNATVDRELNLVSKPIRIGRGGDSGSSRDKHSKNEKVTSIGCGHTVKVDSKSNKWERCPDSCPLYAQDRTDEDFCTFQCVATTDCATMNPKTQIADEEQGICRSCVVDGCKTCDTSVPHDSCSRCQAGYYLKDGQCFFKYGGQWVNVVGAVLAAVVAFVLVWILEWCLRPTVNEAGVEYGMKRREAELLRMKKDADGERKLFPLSTNLMRQPVGGAGMSLHFTFQGFLMIWAVFVALTWMGFAHFVDNDLWLLGTRKFGTPRANCILVAWGYETQQALMWTKVAFLWIVYIGSFLMCVAYGIYQLRSFQEVDFNHKTMKDFVVMVCGLPAVDGSKNVEEDLKTEIERVAQVSCVGVSVAWDYAEHEELMHEAVKETIQEAERESHRNSGYLPSTAEPEMNSVRRFFYGLEKSVLGLESSSESTSSEPSEEGGEDAVEAILKTLHTSPRAFAVFATQEDRDTAVQNVEQANGLSYEGADGITMECLDAEPDTVQWQNYGHSSTTEKAIRLIAGFGIILLACLFWGIVFYSPYAYYVMTFNYENGREPGFIVGFAFSMIVVVGNAIMYEVCAQISDWVGFRFKDQREACYMVLYTVACMFNVALDFVTTYATAEMIMEGLGFRTYFGEPLKDVNEFTAKFETYGMQRSLAENTYGYAFPSTYLIPFLIEPFPSVLVPLFLGRLIVRTHPEVQGDSAAEWLGMAPMEMGRYADLQLNIILGILIFYFPGGYTWMLFLAMAASHVWIYVFDHVRVLRAIPSCTFASYDVEYAAQAMMAPIMGIIAACLVFKSNCEPGMHCLKGPPLIMACCAGWLAHTIVHSAVVKYVIPMFGKEEPEEDPCKDETFETLAHKLPCSWFTSNPVHCLRSHHHYKHSPPCSYFVLGKEQYMKVNKKIGCYFEQSATD